MEEKTKPNWIILISFVVLSIILFIVAFSLYTKEADSWEIFTKISICVWYISFLVIAYSIYSIIRKKKWNRYLKNQLPYAFNYSLEYEIYKRIGRTNNKKWEKKYLSAERTIPHKYSEWKCSLSERYANLLGNEDFYRFLKKTSRSKEIYYDAIISVSVPMEIAVLTVMSSFARTQMEIMAILILSVVMILILVSKEMWGAKREKNFVDDVIEIFHSSSL